MDVSLVTAVPEPTFPILSGYVAFASTLAVSTVFQKVIGISTGTKLFPSLLGFVTVCIASVASQHAAIANYKWIHNHYFTTNLSTPSPFKNLPHQLPSIDWKTIFSPASFERNDHWEVAGFKIPKHDVRIGLLGAVTFKLLGGRFWGISPSSVTHLGSFTRWSIPCGEGYASTAQRTMIERMGKRWGCHTCGSRMLNHKGKFRFVGDHMPPKSVGEQMNKTWLRRSILGKVQYRFYPQCANCSNLQGTILGKAKRQTTDLMPASLRAASLKSSGGGKMAHNHALVPRVNHLAGGVVAGCTIVGATDQQIHKGNQQRFESMQTRIDKLAFRVASCVTNR